MVLGTAAGNMGHLTAVCVMIQNLHQKDLLWSGCRHHNGETVLSRIFDGLKIESSQSPEVAICNRF